MGQFANAIFGAVMGIAAFASLAPIGVSAAPRIDRLPAPIISHAGLDLTDPKDAATPRGRVTRAAQGVCRYDQTVRDIRRMAAQRGCVRRVLALANIRIPAAQRSNGRRKAMAPDMRS